MSVNKQLSPEEIRACAAGLRDGMSGHADFCADIMEQLAQNIAAAEQAQQAEPVAWRVHPFDYGIGSEGVFALTMRTDQVDAWKKKGWAIEPLYAQPPAVAAQPAMAAPEGWRPVPVNSLQNLLCLIDPPPVSLPNDKVMVFKNPNAADVLTRISAEVRAMLAAAPQAATEGCGACGDGCKGQGCRLERESPPTCQTCNGKGMIGGLLPNGGGYDGQPCPDCAAPQTEPLSAAMADIAAERRRQIEAEGWTPEHDDAHSDGQMATAAACYAISAHNVIRYKRITMPSWWPWDSKWWKPSTTRRDLVKAGALIAAEIERIDRAAQKGNR